VQVVTLANAEGNTPLHWACVNHQADAARLLLKAGANASVLNVHDRTPVDEALSRDYQDLVDIINEFNAPVKDVEDVDIPDEPDVQLGDGDGDGDGKDEVMAEG
jgi:ankyrin repeat protein